MGLVERLKENTESSVFFFKVIAIGTVLTLVAGGVGAYKLHKKYEAYKARHAEKQWVEQTESYAEENQYTFQEQ